MNEPRWREMMQAIRKQPEKPAWRCPGENRLAAYADSQLTGVDKERVENHLAGCEYCLGQIAFLVRMKELPPPEQTPAPLLARVLEAVPARQSGLRWRGWAWGAAAAAAACFTIAVALWMGQPGRPGHPLAPPGTVIQQPDVAPAAPEPEPRTVRQVPGAALPELRLPKQDSIVAPGNIEIRWTAAPRSLVYEVRLMTDEGSLIWEGRTEALSLRLPANVPLVAGATYYASVRAHLPEGKSLKSQTVGFQIAESR